ncbi:MAG: hypothetical protein HUJ13_01600 [Hydrogenovibrio crunogenus]|nr:hypothetical protein [Hydrogenovibrio crunogenus]
MAPLVMLQFHLEFGGINMEIFYSAAENGFFDNSFISDYKSAGTWPDDAVELSEIEQATYWRQPPPPGKKLGADVDGRPAWVDLPPPSLDDIAKRKSADIDGKAQAFIDSAIEPYPEFEKLTFERQEREARDYLANNAVATPTISAIATARSLTVDVIAQRVVDKADAFAALATHIAGQRQAYHDQLAAAVAAQDTAAIEAINVAYELPA